MRSAGRHLVGQRAGDDHHVGLARRGARREAEALGVVARHRHLHHLDGAAGEPEGHPHQRAGARPVDQVVGGGDEEALVGELVVDLDEERVVRRAPSGFAGATRFPARPRRSIPFERSLPPLVDEADREHGEEDHHRPEAEPADLAEGDRPRKEEGDLEVEDDEEDRDQVEAHVELHARVVEGVEAALIGRQLLRVGILDRRR